MKCVCALFILVLVVQIVHTKKPQLTSKQNKAQIYVGTVKCTSLSKNMLHEREYLLCK